MLIDGFWRSRFGADPHWKPEIRGGWDICGLRQRREAAIVEELAQDLAECYAELIASGATETEAYQRTLAELSGCEMLPHELRLAERRNCQDLSISKRIGGQL